MIVPKMGDSPEDYFNPQNLKAYIRLYVHIDNMRYTMVIQIRISLTGNRAETTVPKTGDALVDNYIHKT